MIARGALRVDRPGNHLVPSLLRTDVEELAERRADRQAAVKRARRTRQRGEARAAARRADPDCGDWISTEEAARILGCTGVWVRVLASQGRLPTIKRGDGAYRYRRRQITVISNARRTAAARRSTTQISAPTD